MKAGSQHRSAGIPGAAVPGRDGPLRRGDRMRRNGNAHCDGEPARARILASSHRSDANRARDAYRHPRETLLFFGIRPDHTVVEVLPIGRLVHGGHRATGARERAVHRRPCRRWWRAMPTARTSRQKLHRTSWPRARPSVIASRWWTSTSPTEAPMVPDGSADVVLTFRNIHNWMAGGQAEAAFRDDVPRAEARRHAGRGRASGQRGGAAGSARRSGYVNQSYAIRLIEGAGFKLVATSEINANPKDTKDYAGGVWTLPPRLAAGERTDREIRRHRRERSLHAEVRQATLISRAGAYHMLAYHMSFRRAATFTVPRRFSLQSGQPRRRHARRRSWSARSTSAPCRVMKRLRPP